MMIRYCLMFTLLTAEPAVPQTHGRATPAPLAISMSEAIRMALSPQGNLRVEIAEESVRVAQSRWRESRAAALPSVETSITERNQILNLAALGFGAVQIPLPPSASLRSVGPFNTIDARLQIQQSILNLSTGRQSRAARADVETAKHDIEDLRDRVAAETAHAYLKALRAASAQEFAQAGVDAAEAALQEVTNRNAAGQALSVDVAQVRLRLSAEKRRLLEARVERERSAMDLLFLLNRDISTPLELTDPLALTPVDAMTPEEALAVALRSRADVAAVRQRIEAARLRDSAIRAEAFPSIAAHADGGTLGTSIASSTGTYSVGLSLHVPVFNGGIREARREENLAGLRQDELRSSMLKKEIELQVREALIKLEVARDEVEVSTQEVEVAREAVQHHRRRHDEGVGGLADLLEAQASLARANDQRAAALYAWNEGRIDLMQAMGTIRSLGR